MMNRKTFITKTLALVLPAILFSACKEKQEKTKVLVENISESVYASGIIKSKNQYEVFPKVNGLIEEIFIKEGDLVKVGTPLFKIQNEASALNTENAKLSANLAAANKDKIKELEENTAFLKEKMQNDSLLFARQKSLWEKQIGTLVEFEQRELNYKNAQTNYEAALLRLKDTKNQLAVNAQLSQNNFQISNFQEEDFTVKSAMDGKLYSLLKEKGEMVNNMSPVAIIGSANDFIIELQVDENDITRVREGQLILLSMNSYKNKVFEAKVDKINAIMNERARAFKVEASFTKRPPQLFSNLTVEANIMIQTKENALTIPRSYLIDDTYVLNENNEKVEVKTGIMDYQKAEIVSGVKEGEIILKEK